MNLKNLIFRQHYLMELSYSSSNKAKRASKEQTISTKTLYPEDFAEAMFGIFTEKDLKL